MTILTEGSRKAEFIVSEANDWRSRDQATVTVPAAGLASGTILGVVTATGVYVRHDAAAVDGSETEAGILFAPFPADAAGDYPATVIVRDAEVNSAELTYEAGADAAQITASNAALAAIGIIVR